MRFVASGKRVQSVFVAFLLVTGLAVTGVAQRQGREAEGADGPMGPGGKAVMGTVVSVQADGFTVKTQDGEQWKVTVGANTRVMHEREPASVGDVKPNYGVMAFGQADPSSPNTLHAVVASYSTPAEVKAKFADFGKTWLAGKVTAIDGTRITLTVQQPGASSASTASLVVDETTSFKKGREEVTLADLKAGDYVMGKGSIKGGVFVPTELSIRTPGRTPGEYRGRPGAEGGPAGAPPQ